MILAYFILAVILVACIYRTNNKNTIFTQTFIFLGFQVLFLVYTILKKDTAEFGIFKYDSLGILFFAVLTLISFGTAYHSKKYLREETVTQLRLYNIAFISLCIFITGAYFSNNATATWVLIEATTLGSALLIYHRRTDRSLEAAWKYVFVCSVGILIAYLGILFLSIMLKSQHEANMSFQSLTDAVTNANPLYLKLAFALVLTGYSCKMEYFPLYPIGIDANHATPAPMSAFFSTVMVNMGFISVFRIYRVLAESAVFAWVQNVMLVAGLITLFVAAIYIAQVKHSKRLLAYSTVENMGIVLLILSTGTKGIYFAVFHMLMHSLVKSTAFFRLSVIGKIYGSYQLKNLGNYWKVSKHGSLILLFCLFGLTAIPPSALFLSEMYVFSELSNKVILFIISVLLICIVLYFLSAKILKILYGEQKEDLPIYNEDKITLAIQYGFLIIFFILGIYQPEWFMNLIYEI